MVTGLFDETSLDDHPELQRENVRLEAMPVVVDTSHILNESMMQGIGPIAQSDYPASILTVMRQFGLGRLVDAVTAANGVHEIWNILSLEKNLHSKFDDLDLWFEGTSEVRHSETFH